MVLLQNIKKEYKGTKIFENVHLTVLRGQSIAIRGKSGVGKSTLLNIIAGLEKPTSGSYVFNELDMSGHSLNDLSKVRGEKIGYISQFSPMIPNLTVLDNIRVPLWFDHKAQSKSVEKQIEEYSQIFEIKHLLPKKIEMLSGGEIQRVGVIRSLIRNPELIVADEPTGALDDETACTVLNSLNSLKSQGISILIATHSSIVAEHCDQVYRLTKHGLLPEAT